MFPSGRSVYQPKQPCDPASESAECDEAAEALAARMAGLPPRVRKPRAAKVGVRNYAQPTAGAVAN
ncbi:MAG: hypothetical protein QOD74_2201 [Variibacter sp.]|nr:hypothetical protein [Variibacter sp.]